MSVHIPNVGAAGRTAVTESADRAKRAERAAKSDDAVALDVQTIPATPPEEVHAAMAVADSAYDRLAASGRMLSFHLDDGSGKLTVEVHDLEGKVLFTVPASKALGVASGDSLE